MLKYMTRNIIKKEKSVKKLANKKIGEYFTVGELKKVLNQVSDETPVLVYGGRNECSDVVNAIFEYKNTLKNYNDDDFGKGLPCEKGDWCEVKNGENILVLQGNYFDE
jgi:hypothetical protein